MPKFDMVSSFSPFGYHTVYSADCTYEFDLKVAEPWKNWGLILRSKLQNDYPTMMKSNCYLIIAVGGNIQAPLDLVYPALNAVLTFVDFGFSSSAWNRNRNPNWISIIFLVRENEKFSSTKRKNWCSNWIIYYSKIWAKNVDLHL